MDKCRYPLCFYYKVDAAQYCCRKCSVDHYLEIAVNDAIDKCQKRKMN
jgi:hypothetical protein